MSQKKLKKIIFFKSLLIILIWSFFAFSGLSMILFFYYKSLVLLIPFSLPLILNFLLALIHRKVYATIQNANKLSKQQQEETKKLDEKNIKQKL
ncbi:hypothetical protein AB668_02160 [Mycoplasma sp. HU2014]|nr:hypothetical protein AB668_02160 [Mycoplasma sp. HU2014]